MPNKVTPERVAAIAEAASIALDQNSAARVADAVNPTVTLFKDQKIALPLEVEPATYAVEARRGMRK
jgi:Asp-tRNA(Asn)/Glu-tRNA(Gln) amidotransferase C subunit